MLDVLVKGKNLFALEELPFFYGFIGLGSVVLVVVMVFVLRKVLVRPASYYENEEPRDE